MSSGSIGASYQGTAPKVFTFSKYCHARQNRAVPS